MYSLKAGFMPAFYLNVFLLYKVLRAKKAPVWGF
tara:strand:+ start:2501 stop:2602 length:102 start_codon:yes stop_codon:yes gene_type:complete